MCNPASFVIVKKGSSLKALWYKSISESHENIIDHFKLREKNVRGEYLFARVEITPPNNDFTKPLSKWKYKLDESDTSYLPVWWDNRKAEKAARMELKEWRKTKIILPKQNRKKITQTDYIVMCLGTIDSVDGGTINSVDGGTINWVDDGTINSVYDGTINNVYGGTINSVDGGTINRVYDGTINSVDGGTINKVHSGTIDWVHSGTINRVYGGTINSVDGGTVIYYKKPDVSILKKGNAVIIDRSGKTPICYVDKQ